jgi:UDPglucose 6-dehydrogenase
MKVGVVGLGHVGLVTAACFAHVGHEVIGVDVQAERVEGLRRGNTPFYEPGLPELIRDGLDAGRLTFDQAIEAVVGGPDIVFICVGTPSRPSGEADLTQVERLALELAQHLDSYLVLVEKSTVPVKTGERLFKTMHRLGARDFDVVSNPEFLREGSAIADTLQPDRVVIGSQSDRATNLMLELYDPIVQASGAPLIVTDIATAELVKHASNAFLATKISFINAVAEICERTGADVGTVSYGMGLDRRIGQGFLQAGIGYGGSCFPKDIAAFAVIAEQLGAEFQLLGEVQRINDRGPERLLSKLRGELWHLQGKQIAVLGLAFKPGTDDLREAPSHKVILQLLSEGAEVVTYDPVAMGKAKEVLPSSVRFADSALDALDRADAAVFVTDWDEFKDIDPSQMRESLRFPIVVDGRNLFDLKAMQAAGMTYLSVGRPPVQS